MCAAPMRKSTGKGRIAVPQNESFHTEQFLIREMKAADVSQVRIILQKSREAADWSPESIQNSLESSHISAFVSYHGAEISGFIFGARAADEAEILNLAVQPERRRTGEGRALVQQLLGSWAGKNLKRVFLEVRESNHGAIKFYEQRGFQQVGRRRRYYDGPEEDALVLQQTILQSNPQIGTR